MVRLFLLRHAKASQSSPDGGDKSRPLNQRGRDASATMGRYMRDQGLRPEIVLCSTAERTRETLQLLCDAAGWTEDDPKRTFADELYLPPSSEIISILQQLDNSASDVLVIGHNPGMHELAYVLADPRSRDYERLLDKYPTCALAVLNNDSIGWQDIDAGRLTLTHYVVPRDLVG